MLKYVLIANMAGVVQGQDCTRLEKSDDACAQGYRLADLDVMTSCKDYICSNLVGIYSIVHGASQTKKLAGQSYGCEIESWDGTNIAEVICMRESAPQPGPSPPGPGPPPTPNPDPQPISSMTIQACGAASCRSSRSFPVGACAPIHDLCDGSHIIAYGIASDYISAHSATLTVYSDDRCSDFNSTIYLSCSCASYQGFWGQLFCSAPEAPSSSGSNSSLILSASIGGSVLFLLAVIGTVFGYVALKRRATGGAGSYEGVMYHNAVPLQTFGQVN